MDITVLQQGDATILALSGRMDATTVGDFEQAWRDRIDAGETRIVVDLAGIEYISSAGLRGILALLKMCKSKGGRLAFCSMGSMVAEVFKISGFTAMLSIHDNRDGAVAFVGA